MNIRPAESAMLLTILLTGTVTTAPAGAADDITSGRWRFTTEMRMPATAQPPPGAQGRPGGPTKMTRTACIDPANPVPAETQGDVPCKVDKVQRNGGTVTWSMTCTPAQGAPVRSDGVAHYAGTTMEATFTSHLTAPDGRPVDNPGRISGRYVGPCEVR